MDLLYINGDSYTAPTKHKVYADFLETAYNMPVVNRAYAGTTNDRIFRSSLNDLIKLKDEYRDIKAIIGFTFVTRTELWFDEKDSNPLVGKKVKGYNQHDNHNGKFVTLDWVNHVSEENNHWKQYIDSVRFYSNFNKQVADFYTDLVMFANALENIGIDYLLFSAANNNDHSEANWDFLNMLPSKQWCDNNDRILDIHNFNIQTFIKDNNLKPADEAWHMDEEGHKQFSEFLMRRWLM